MSDYQDYEWKAAFELIRQAERLPVSERLEFASNHVSDPAMRILALDLLTNDDSGESANFEMMPGRRVGDYQITDKLGRGGMSRVYAARHIESCQRVALKLLAPELVKEGRSVNRLIKEARTASALNHPNIVKVYGIVRSGDDIAIAMELLEGESLRWRCNAPQDSQSVAQWGGQIAGALAIAHQNDIVHCDIKPENLMLDRKGNLKVIDFGLARHLSSARSEPIADSGGTIEYFTPEQVAGEHPIKASDIFALGVVLYELSAGKHPFSGQTLCDSLHNIAYETPDALSAYKSGVPWHLENLILRMLEKDPRLRPTADQCERALKFGGRSTRAIALLRRSIQVGHDPIDMPFGATVNKLRGRWREATT